jgi:hypothetical protein
MIENGNVSFNPTNPDVTFEGDIIQNNCSDNTGTLIVEAKQGSDETDVLVQVTASTELMVMRYFARISWLVKLLKQEVNC